MTSSRVAYSVDDVRGWAPKDAAVTLGVFDGVHRGHERIISDLLELRTKRQVASCYVVTFDPHPLVVTHSKMTPPMLTTLEERIHLLGQFDVDGIVVLKFDTQLANVDYRTFLDRYLLRPFDMKWLVLGYDCYFGRNREGSPERVKAEAAKMRFQCTIVPVVSNDGDAISSTKIRNALIEGDLSRANSLLGHPYLLKGRVVRGHGKGAEIGFPTANLAIEAPFKLWPCGGVYAIRAQTGDRLLGGMMNIGRAPTIKNLDADANEIEVHLFDFDDDLYGEDVWVHCLSFLREERRFPSVAALVGQLKADKTRALTVLAGESEPG